MIHFDSYVWDGLKPPHKKTEVRPSGWVEAEFKVVGNSGWLGFCFATVPIWWKKHPSYVLLRKANAKHPVVLLQVLRGGHWLAANGFSTPSQELRRRAWNVWKNGGTSSQSLLSFTIVVFHVLLFQPLDFPGAVSKLHLVPFRCQNGGGGQCLQDGEAESNQRVRADQ